MHHEMRIGGDAAFVGALQHQSCRARGHAFHLADKVGRVVDDHVVDGGRLEYVAAARVDSQPDRVHAAQRLEHLVKRLARDPFAPKVLADRTEQQQFAFGLCCLLGGDRAGRLRAEGGPLVTLYGAAGHRTTEGGTAWGRHLAARRRLGPRLRADDL